MYNRLFKIFFITILCVAAVFSGCGKKQKTVVVNNTKPVETTQTQAQTEEQPTVERTKYVRLEVVNKKEGIEVRILDENSSRITGVPFTICLVSNGGRMILDKEQSGTIEGREYRDENGEGAIFIEILDSGTYEIYLRPLEEYLDASPIPLSFVVYKIDEAIEDKIKQEEEIDVAKEDKSYITSDDTQEGTRPEIDANKVKVSNIISNGFILGNSKEFKVTVPEYTEDEEIIYEKINSIKLESTSQYSDYIKSNNRETILIKDTKKSVYVLEEKKYDIRLDETYISKAIINEGGEYYIYSLVPHMTTGEENVYIGWYSKKGKHYYNDEDGYPVTGWKKLDGAWYYFNEDGQKASVTGIDVSEYQEIIDWEAVKTAGIDFAMIRCGYRGYGSGVLVEDRMFEENIKGATAAGMPFGVYIFSQAITTTEAIEEASMILELTRGYEPTLPYAIDIEACGDEEMEGRQNGLSSKARTQIINTFVSVIRGEGEEPMLYSNKRYLEDDMDISQITCKIWFAMWPGEDDESQDAVEKDENMVPNREIEIWQYSSLGEVDGIEPVVDLNAWIPNLD